MDILKNNVSVSRYFILDPANSVPCDDELKENAFQPIDEVLQESSFGFVQFDDYEKPLSEPFKLDGQTFLRLRIDRRKIPAAIFKRRFQQALKEEEKLMEKQGGKFITRNRKNEIKENVRISLLKKTEPTPKTISIIVGNDEVWIFTTTASDLEIAEGLFGLLAPVNPYNIENLDRIKSGELAPDPSSEGAGQDMTVNFLTGLCNDEKKSEFAVYNELKISNDLDRMTYQGEGVASCPQVQEAINDGWRAFKATLCSESDYGEYRFKLDSDYSFSGIKTPSAESDMEEDLSGAILEKIYLLDQLFESMDREITAK